MRLLLARLEETGVTGKLLIDWIREWLEGRKQEWSILEKPRNGLK